MSKLKDIETRIESLNKQLVEIKKNQEKNQKEIKELKELEEGQDKEIISLRKKFSKLNKQRESNGKFLEDYKKTIRENEEFVKSLSSLAEELQTKCLTIGGKFNLSLFEDQPDLIGYNEPQRNIISYSSNVVEEKVEKLKISYELPVFSQNGQSSISKVITNGTWQIHCIKCKTPPLKGFVLTIYIDKIIKHSNSWGFQIGVLYNNFQHLDGSTGSWLGKASNGVGYIALNGKKEISAGTGITYGAIYGTGDTIKMIVHNNKNIEFFKNDISQGIAHYIKFPVIPAVGIVCEGKFTIVDYYEL
eukprot:TRINITY_DN1482_c0_g1_i1.p1 TRINITY_DN1482_c0_g1~~TRINITY_DN1482_c0_g1_i1.p1  ORF type:complete len:303 (+),score=81.93 TRINITY_DN1482_c0_g1_i1:74-982(+)